MTETKAEKELTPREKAEAKLQEAANARQALRATHNAQIKSAREKRSLEVAAATKKVQATLRDLSALDKAIALEKAEKAAGQKTLFESPDSQPSLPAAGDAGTE